MSRSIYGTNSNMFLFLYLRNFDDDDEVRGLMPINVGCEFLDRGSIPSMCQISDADLGQVG